VQKRQKKLLGKPGVVFVSGDSSDSFPSQHIPGSVEMGAHHLHHSDVIGTMHCTPLYQCIPEMEHHIGAKGIDNSTLVIAYDGYKGPNATGVYHFFKMIGHDNVKILNGGIAALKKAGVKMEKGKEKVAYAKHYHIDPKKINYNIGVGADHVLGMSNKITSHVQAGGKKRNAEKIIIDTRSMNEIIGGRKVDNVARGGHIPGATFVEWKQITDEKNKISFPTDSKSIKTIQAKFNKLGITKDKEIVAYCHMGTGRGSDLYVALELLGYKNIKVYTGSWDEWGNSKSLPVRK